MASHTGVFAQREIDRLVSERDTLAELLAMAAEALGLAWFDPNGSETQRNLRTVLEVVRRRAATDGAVRDALRGVQPWAW